MVCGNIVDMHLILVNLLLKCYIIEEMLLAGGTANDGEERL